LLFGGSAFFEDQQDPPGEKAIRTVKGGGKRFGLVGRLTFKERKAKDRGRSMSMLPKGTRAGARKPGMHFHRVRKGRGQNSSKDTDGQQKTRKNALIHGFGSGLKLSLKKQMPG